MLDFQLQPWFFLGKDPKSRSFLAGLIESLHSAPLAFALLHCQDQNKSCRPLCSPRVDLVSLKSSRLTPSHTLLCTLRQVNTHTLRTVAPGWFYIHDKEPSLWISKTHIWLAVGMTHTLGLSRSQQAAGRPTRSRSGRSQRRPSIRACRGQRLAAYISRPREHGLALLSGPFVLTFPYPSLGRSLTDPKNTRAPQYQSASAEHALWVELWQLRTLEPECISSEERDAGSPKNLKKIGIILLGDVTISKCNNKIRSVASLLYIGIQNKHRVELQSSSEEYQKETAVGVHHSQPCSVCILVWFVFVVCSPVFLLFHLTQGTPKHFHTFWFQTRWSSRSSTNLAFTWFSNKFAINHFCAPTFSEQGFEGHVWVVIIPFTLFCLWQRNSRPSATMEWQAALPLP